MDKLSRRDFAKLIVGTGVSALVLKAIQRKIYAPAMIQKNESKYNFIDYSDLSKYYLMKYKEDNDMPSILTFECDENLDYHMTSLRIMKDMIIEIKDGSYTSDEVMDYYEDENIESYISLPEYLSEIDYEKEIYTADDIDGIIESYHTKKQKSL